MMELVSKLEVITDIMIILTSHSKRPLLEIMMTQTMKSSVSSNGVSLGTRNGK